MSDVQATLLEAFVKDHVPKVMRQFEHLFVKNKHASGYFVQDKVRSADLHRASLANAPDTSQTSS